MTATEKNMYKNMETVYYYSGWGGIEFKGIVCDENKAMFAIFVAGAWCSHPSVHKTKIYWTDCVRRPYFVYNKHRIHLDDLIYAKG